MKRVNELIFGSTFVLLAGVSLASCSSSDDVTDAPVNPTYDGKSVKTQFAINIATPVTGKTSTRMTGENTQNGGGTLGNTNKFLGMENILLMPFNSTDPLNVTGTTTTTDTRAKDTQIDQVIALSTISNTELAADKSNKIYYDVNIPINTANFLFYGTGPLGTDNDSRFESGALNIPSVALSGKTLDDIKYSLITCLSQNTGYTTKANNFATFLNGICEASCEYNTTTYHWNNLSPSANETKLITLKKAYDDFTTIGSTGARGGSGNAVLYVLQELYDICQGVLGGVVTSTAPTAGAAELLAWNIIQRMTTNTNIPVTVTNGELSYINTEDKTFPVEKYAIPEGAAQLIKNNDNKFAYATDAYIGNNGGVTSKLSFNPSNVTFPAALTYFVNTPARATTKELVNSDWPNTVTAWDNVWTAGFNSWTNSVNANSRTVALQYNINYGVACLATTVQCKSGVSYLEDNASVITQNNTNPLEDQQIAIPTDGFKVTGILIGGQSQTVGWDFLDPSSTNQKYVVYDKDINGTTGMYAKSGAQTATNYTLVFDNFVSEIGGGTIEGSQQKVKVAIELQNGGEEFYGVDGKIGKGQKFYLVAELDPLTNNTNITWPDADKSNYPARDVKRVFMQDYTTTANFTINSLRNAYVTIPDLRASNLQLGLSVDLTWQNGLTFDVTID